MFYNITYWYFLKHFGISNETKNTLNITYWYILKHFGNPKYNIQILKIHLEYLIFDTTIDNIWVSI
jgi:hypothetical protein